MTALTRLEQLRELRRQLDREIEREETAARRVAKIRRDALTTLTRGAWNQRVFTASCQHHGADVDHVLSGARDQAATDARHTFMWLMRNTGRSYPEIGLELGMDHTSAMNGVRRVDRTPTLLAAAAEIHLSLTGDSIQQKSAS